MNLFRVEYASDLNKCNLLKPDSANSARKTFRIYWKMGKIGGLTSNNTFENAIIYGSKVHAFLRIVGPNARLLIFAFDFVRILFEELTPQLVSIILVRIF